MSLHLLMKSFLLTTSVAADPCTLLWSQLQSCPAAGKATKTPASVLTQPEGASFWDTTADTKHQTQAAVTAHPSSCAVCLRERLSSQCIPWVLVFLLGGFAVKLPRTIAIDWLFWYWYPLKISCCILISCHKAPGKNVSLHQPELAGNQ